MSRENAIVPGENWDYYTVMSIEENKKKKFTIYDPIFNQKIIVFLNYEPTTYLKWEKSMGVAEENDYNSNLVAFSTHMSAEDEPNTYIIYIRHFNWCIDDQETLIHELIHTVIRIWEANNIRFSVETQEFYAHSVGRLYAMVAKKLI